MVQCLFNYLTFLSHFSSVTCLLNYDEEVRGIKGSQNLNHLKLVGLLHSYQAILSKYCKITKITDDRATLW